jgi:hypothetical protein
MTQHHVKFLEVIMFGKFRKIILFYACALLILSPTTSFAWHDYSYTGGWDYYGSGRDEPYSSYIDRHYTLGYADYSPISADYIDEDLFIKHATPVIVPLPALQNEFTVNVPNDHGGFTAVVIKRSGNGFTGPQGEYYPEFPKVFQLQIMYGNGK